MRTSLRSTILATSALLVGLVAACGAPTAPGAESSGADPGQVPDKPAKPVTLNILDVAGNLQLTQGMIDDFVKQHPDVISKVTYSKAPAPDLVGKLKAQQSAGRLDIGLVLTGTDGLSAGAEQGLWQDVLPTFKDRLSNMDTYQEPAAKMQELGGKAGVVVTYYPSGPLFEYLPEKVANPPKTAEELLAYAKANPGKVAYARPANSGPGRTFLMGLPYILGDKDPMDPVNGWAKTWAYLAELGKYVNTYPSGTTQTMKDLANGTVNIVASTTGWDINPRVLGTVPESAKITTLNGFHFVTDAHYAVIPKGASGDQQAAVLQLIQFMLTKEQQAKAYDDGYFYPGPAVEGVDISMAPQKSQDAIAKFGRPEYEELIAKTPKEVPLDNKAMVAAFDKWDREIGGSKVKQQ
ncbi:putative spermidine/putrescine transport system substrate-binding protein [Kribbella amoyensis]|uniref:Putative spermidine/putrescine transport system substrate-binding protein n=1 Tax=Kribbella amoyensis TaxID=996641 RepID=A0A561BYR8_9ACTN|nr:extracellular solute-binding protein [Kribbella amoyensis]TWD83842.1 putative spermidine/putrescine transport system substrate-binding protein [Kribbella amoyensis]